MKKMERAIYTADVDNSMLELVESEISTSWKGFDSTLAYQDITIFPCETNVEFPKRNFWEIAKNYPD